MNPIELDEAQGLTADMVRAYLERTGWIHFRRIDPRRECLRHKDTASKQLRWSSVPEELWHLARCQVAAPDHAPRPIRGHARSRKDPMSPNGRRRWRRACRTLRHSEGSSYSAAEARRNRKRPSFIGLPLLPTVPLNPTPLSLVGMTMGARKRAARRDAVTANASGLSRATDPAIRRTLARLFVLSLTPTGQSLPGFADSPRKYDEARTLYRIGDRLRPCRFCQGPELFERCRGKNIAIDVAGDHRRGECVFCRTCVDAAKTLRFANPDACDGSGVLPAFTSEERRARKRPDRHHKRMSKADAAKLDPQKRAVRS